MATTRAVDDPVRQAQRQLDDAREAETAAAAALQEFSDRVLEDNATGKRHAELTHTIELTRLRRQAAERHLDEATEAARQQQLALLKIEILEDGGTADQAADAEDREAIAAAVGRIAGRHRTRQGAVPKWIARMRQLDVPPARPGRPDLADPHAGLSWSPSSAFLGECVLVDRQRIAIDNPTGDLLCDAILQGLKTAGVGTGWLRPAVRLAPKREEPSWTR